MLELCLRFGDSDPSRWREGDHDTAAGDSATAPSLAATRSRSTRSAASADPDPSASASPVTKTSRRSVCAVGAFAGEGFAEGARETLAETLAEPAAEPAAAVAPEASDAMEAEPVAFDEAAATREAKKL